MTKSEVDQLATGIYAARDISYDWLTILVTTNKAGQKIYIELKEPVNPEGMWDYLQEVFPVSWIAAFPTKDLPDFEVTLSYDPDEEKIK